jgi:predicted nucleic acid binding AN1-type Zn finger protein
MEYFTINGSRIELRCGNCNGLVNWWVEHPCKRNIIPVRRGWSERECEAMY